MGDLHCPATVLLASYGDATQARALAERLRSRRVAHVWGGDPGLVGALAAVLEVGVSVRAELGSADADAVRAFLEEVADAHRGETALVVADAEVLRLAVEALAPTRAEEHLPDMVELSSDEHGWARVG